MRFLVIILMVLFLCSCNSAEKDRQHLEAMQNSPSVEKYEFGIACMRYISKRPDDIEYSKTLVRKLLDAGFFAEAIQCVGLLNHKFPHDPELFYLRGKAYRSLHQYILAMYDLNLALKIQSGDRLFTEEVHSLMEEQKTWGEIQALNESLASATDSSKILLNRADYLYEVREYDAVLFDLGMVSKLGSREDSLYFARTVSSLNQKGSRNSVEILLDLMRYYRGKMP